jgi:hypothetical protein
MKTLNAIFFYFNGVFPNNTLLVDQCELSAHSQKSLGFNSHLQSPIKLFIAMPLTISLKQHVVVNSGVNVGQRSKGLLTWAF